MKDTGEDRPSPGWERQLRRDQMILEEIRESQMKKMQKNDSLAEGPTDSTGPNGSGTTSEA